MVIFLCLKILNKKLSNTKYVYTVFLYTVVLFNISTFTQTLQLKRIFYFFTNVSYFFIAIFMKQKRRVVPYIFGQVIVG